MPEGAYWCLLLSEDAYWCLRVPNGVSRGLLVSVDAYL